MAEQEPKGKEPMEIEIVDNDLQEHYLHPHQTRPFLQQSTSISPQGLIYGEGRITLAHIQLVQNLIERCLQLYMDQSHVATTLHEQANISPAFTNLIWKKIEEQNSEFFKEYYMRLKLKDQIVEFNHLLEQQARMMELKEKTSFSLQNARMGHPTPASAPIEYFGYMPLPHSLLVDGNLIITENGGWNGPGGILLDSFSHAYTGPIGMTTPTTSMGMDGTQNLTGDLHVNVPNMGVPNSGVTNTGVSNTGVSNTGVSNTGVFNTGVSNTGVSNMGGLSRTVSLKALGQMTQNFNFPDLTAYFASRDTSQSDSSGHMSKSFSFSELTAFTSGGASQSESLLVIPKTYSFSEVLASDELNINAGDVNMEHLGSIRDLSILAPKAVLQSPNENEHDDKSLLENIFRLEPLP